MPKEPRSLKPYRANRALNVFTTSDRHLLHPNEDLTSNLNGINIERTIYILKASHQILVTNLCIPKTAIIVIFHVYQYLPAPSGFRNPTQTFRRFINEVYRELAFIFRYVCDILFPSSMDEEHQKRRGQLFARFQEHALVIGTNKFLKLAG